MSARASRDPVHPRRPAGGVGEPADADDLARPGSTPHSHRRRRQGAPGRACPRRVDRRRDTRAVWTLRALPRCSHRHDCSPVPRSNLTLQRPSVCRRRQHLLRARIGSSPWPPALWWSSEPSSREPSSPSPGRVRHRKQRRRPRRPASPVRLPRQRHRPRQSLRWTRRPRNRNRVTATPGRTEPEAGRTRKGHRQREGQGEEQGVARPSVVLLVRADRRSRPQGGS